MCCEWRLSFRFIDSTRAFTLLLSRVLAPPLTAHEIYARIRMLKRRRDEREVHVAMYQSC